VLNQLTGIVRRPAPKSWSRVTTVTVGAALLMVSVLGIAIWLNVSSLLTNSESAAATNDPDLESVVRLSPAKIAAAHVHASPVELRTLQETRRVPGKIGYNASRRLEVKMPVAGL